MTVRGQFALFLGPFDVAMENLRMEMYRRYVPPLVALRSSSVEMDVGRMHDVPNTMTRQQQQHAVDAAAALLPPNVGLLALYVDHHGCDIVRLSHLFAVKEHSVTS